jgi:hypothetical protein
MLLGFQHPDADMTIFQAAVADGRYPLKRAMAARSRH